MLKQRETRFTLNRKKESNSNEEMEIRILMELLMKTHQPTPSVQERVTVSKFNWHLYQTYFVYILNKSIKEKI